MPVATVLSKAYKKWHLIGNNPAEAVELDTFDDKRVRFLNDKPDDGSEVSEYKRLRQAISETDSPDLKLAFELAIYTGGRKGEVLGLLWSEVNLEKSYVVFNRTKNKDIRSIAIPDHIVAMFEARKITRTRFDSELVFPNNPIGNNIVKPVDLKKSWTTARVKANVRDFRWHDLRHTHASYLAMEGATSLEIAAVLGHKTQSMVKRYAHLSPDHVTRTSALVSSRLGGGDD
jgi:integrase